MCSTKPTIQSATQKIIIIGLYDTVSYIIISFCIQFLALYSKTTVSHAQQSADVKFLFFPEH